MKKVVIIGGGITGLAAAYDLQQRSVEYLLLERDKRLGGKILTEKTEGFTIEGGPDCFLAEKPSVAALSHRLGITGRLLCTNEEQKGTLVLSRGRLHQLPEGLMLMVPTKILPFVLTPLISWPGKLRMALDLVLPRGKGDVDETLAGFVNRRLGKEALARIAGPLIGGIHGSDAEEMSLKASFPRFLQMEQQYGSLIRAMLAARKKGGTATSGKAGEPQRTYFMSFVDGMGELTSTLASRLDPGKIVTGCEVARIQKGKQDQDGPGYTLHVAGRPAIQAEALIVTPAANDAAAMIGGLDDRMAYCLRQIPMATSATVTLAFKRADISGLLRCFGFLVPQIENRSISAVTFISSKWNYRVPGPEYVLMRIFVGGAYNQELVDLGDEELFQLVRRELKEITGITARPELEAVHRWIKCRPQYTIGHLERVAALEERMAAHPGFYLAGASYRGIGVPDCISDGLKAAGKARAFLSP